MTCTKDAIPADARIIHAEMNFKSGGGQIDLIIESEEFSPVADGDPIPELMPVYVRTYPPTEEAE